MRVLPFFTILVTLLVSSLSVPREPELVWDVQVVAVTDEAAQKLGMFWHGSHSGHLYAACWPRSANVAEPVVAYLEQRGQAKRLTSLTSRGDSVYLDASWNDIGVRVGPELKLTGKLESDGHLAVQIDAAVQCRDSTGSAVQGKAKIERRHKIGDALRIDVRPITWPKECPGEPLTYGDFGTVAILATPTLEE